MTIDLSCRVARTEGMMSAPVDDDIVILNIPKNNYVSLDQIGRRIWDLIESPVAVSDLCSTLAGEFEGGQEQICADVLSFLNELLKEDLVQVIS